MVNSTKGNQGSGLSTNFVCYEWKQNFGTRRDIALPLTFAIPPDMSLQVYKYSGSNSTEELIGEARNCDLSSSFAIAIANCTGFSVKLVGKTCEESKLSSTAITTFYYSTKIVSESRFGMVVCSTTQTTVVVLMFVCRRLSAFIMWRCSMF